MAVASGACPSLEEASKYASSGGDTIARALERGTPVAHKRGERRIVVEVTNGGSEPTSPGVLVIEAAPLGAFVPGYEIARVPVLALDLGGRRRVRVTVARSLLPTTRGPEGLRDQALDVLRREWEVVSSAEWAGNLNVWFDAAPERAVEAHRALDLTIAAGRRAAMWVFLPSDEAGFEFAVTAPSAGWTAELVSWLGTPALVVGAPAAGNRTAITLNVTRRSDGAWSRSSSASSPWRVRASTSAAFSAVAGAPSRSRDSTPVRRADGRKDLKQRRN